MGSTLRAIEGEEGGIGEVGSDSCPAGYFAKSRPELNSLSLGRTRATEGVVATMVEERKKAKERGERRRGKRGGGKVPIGDLTLARLGSLNVFTMSSKRALYTFRQRRKSEGEEGAKEQK